MRKRNRTAAKLPVSVMAALCLLIVSLPGCRREYTPKPRSYFRIDFPEKQYVIYRSDCNYSFEYPVYGVVRPYQGPGAEPCWINIEFPAYKGKIHLTFKTLHGNLAAHAEDIHTLAYKHIIKADDILERPVAFPDRKVYGLVYEIKGNTASSLSFYVTDSVRNFLSGALYFSVEPNKDSLAPVVRFFSEDVDHLISTLTWGN